VQGNDLDVAGCMGHEATMDENFFGRMPSLLMACPARASLRGFASMLDVTSMPTAWPEIADDKVDLEILVQAAEAEHSMFGPGHLPQMTEHRRLEHARADIGNPKRSGADAKAVMSPWSLAKILAGREVACALWLGQGDPGRAWQSDGSLPAPKASRPLISDWLPDRRHVLPGSRRCLSR